MGPSCSSAAMPLRWRSVTERILLTRRLRSFRAFSSADRWRDRARSTRHSRTRERSVAATTTASAPALERPWAALAARL